MSDAPRTDPPGTPAEGEPRPARRARPPLNADGMERPAFVLEFPEDPELDRLVAAFEAGNYALVRRDAERVAAATQDPEVRDAALELRRRIDPDPLARYLLGLAVALLAWLTIWAYGR